MLKLETRSDIIHFEATNPESFVICFSNITIARARASFSGALPTVNPRAAMKSFEECVVTLQRAWRRILAERTKRSIGLPHGVTAVRIRPAMSVSQPFCVAVNGNDVCLRDSFTGDVM